MAPPTGYATELGAVSTLVFNHKERVIAEMVQSNNVRRRGQNGCPLGNWRTNECTFAKAMAGTRRMAYCFAAQVSTASTERW